MANGELTHVRQSHSYSCGAACLAIVARKHEQEAIEAIWLRGPPKGNLRTKWPHLKRGLNRLGLGPVGRAKRVAEWSRIKGVAIVGVEVPNKDDWHWVVVDPARNQIFDPLKAEVKALDKVRRKPFSFLSVKPAR